MKNSEQHSEASVVKPMMPLRLVLCVSAVGLFFFALMGAIHPAMFTRLECWWLMIASMAIFVVGVAVRTPWQMAGIAAAIFLTGFGAQLALRDPYWFQHVRFGSTNFSYVMMAVVFIQVVGPVLILMRQRVPKQLIRVCSDLGWVRVSLFVLVLVAASKGAMDFVAVGNYPRFTKHLIIGSVFVGLNIANFVAILVALPDAKLAELRARMAQSISLPGSEDDIRKFDRVFLIGLAAALFVLSILINLVSFKAVPHLDDILYLFHARYLADGLFALPIPPSIDAFDHYLMDTYQDRWFVTTFPGWSLVLALGVKIGAPWIINPLLAALSVLLLHSFMKTMTDRGTANLAILLMAVSPWYISMAATQLIHTFTYALILGAWLLLLKARGRPSVIMPFLAGVLMGWLVMTRPLEGFFMGVLTGLWALTFLKDKRQWQTVFAYGAGCVVIGGLIFPYNAYLTGDPFLTPLNNYYNTFWGPGSNALGFGPNRGAPDWGNVDVFKGHSPLEALINNQQNLYELNFSLLGWGAASLAFPLFFALWGRWSKFTAAMAVIIGVTFGLYSLFWFYGGYFAGPRYWFMMIVPLLILCVFGIVTAAHKLDCLYPTGQIPCRIGVGVVFLCICSVLVFESWLGFNRYPGINGYHEEYQTLARQERYRNSLMFISSDAEKEFGSAFWLNNFSETSDSPLFAIDLGPESNRIVAAAYPDRQIYFLGGRSTKRDRVTFLHGPLSVTDLD